jgi:hypothetical protein
MDDLQLTKEFEEAIAAISNDITQNPQKYKQAGEWLDQYYDKDFCQKKMQKRSEMLLVEVFMEGINHNEFYCPIWHSSGSPTIKAYEVLQAVAMDEFNYFASMWDILERDHLFDISAGSLTRQMAKDIVATHYNRKTYAALKDRLWLAYKEMLEIKEQCKFLGQEESERVCLLTWLLANPDVNKTALGITEFDKWEWYSLYESGVCSQRANVIRLLHTCKMLQDWQNLTCEAWQNIKNIDSEIERPTKKDVNPAFNDVGANLPAETGHGNKDGKEPEKGKLTLKNVISQLWDLQNALHDCFDSELGGYYRKWYEDADEKHIEPALIGFTKILSSTYTVRKNLKAIQHPLVQESNVTGIIDQLCISLEKTQKEVIETQEKLKGLSEAELSERDYESPMERLHEGYWSAYDECMDEDLGAHILCLENNFLREQAESNPAETNRLSSRYLSIADLIKHFEIPKSQEGRFRKKIERSRDKKEFGDGFFREIANPRVNEPKYEYKTEKVALIVEEMKKRNVQRVSNEKKGNKK